jgi:hypothetical protein
MMSPSGGQPLGAYEPPGGWLPLGHNWWFQLLLIISTILCGLYTIEVGVWGHISKLVKDRLRSLFRSWVPPGHRSGVAQMIEYASLISLVCSFSIFQARNNPVRITLHLVSHY